jgi:hypothetical protein
MDFTTKTAHQSVTVKFRRSTLPVAQGKFHLKAVNQRTLNITEIASKAEKYKIHTSPKVIVDGFNAAMALIKELMAEGYKINTPLCSLRLAVPGMYEGSEQGLRKDVRPKPCIRASRELSDYLAGNVELYFDGYDEQNGDITNVEDKASGLVNNCLTVGHTITISGSGLKFDERAGDEGVYFEASDGSDVQADEIIINEPRRVSLRVPDGLLSGEKYRVVIWTRISMRGSVPLKNLRSIVSSAELTARS